MKYNIQLLRAVAAYMVVFHHLVDALKNYLAIGRFDGLTDVGATGVSIFFVVSGYVMAMTTSSNTPTPSKFYLNRIVRIWPLYALLTLIVVGFKLGGFAIFGAMEFSTEWLLKSLFFAPFFGSDGSVVNPLLFVGWTLNYEMAFYAVFGACLLIRNENLRLATIMFLIAAAFCGQRLTDHRYLDYWGADIVLAFACGIAIWMKRNLCVASPVSASVILITGIFGLLFADLSGSFVEKSFSSYVVTLSSAMLVYASLQLERLNITQKHSVFVEQGNASYSLYLVHPFVLQIMGKISIKTGLNQSDAGLAVTLLAMLVSCGVVGWLTHVWLEKPIIRAIKRSRTVAPVAAS